MLVIALTHINTLKNNYQKFTTPILRFGSLKIIIKIIKIITPMLLFGTFYAYQSFQTLKKHKNNVIIINTHL